MRESLFGRLFTYARSTAIDQVENFATEALASCIRTDPGPLIDIVTARGLLEARPVDGTVHVTTQEVVSSVGVIDLVVRIFEARHLTSELWFEVKVWAPESGDQLARYERHLRTGPQGVRRTLAIIGPRPVGEDASIPWIPWQAIRDVGLRGGAASHLWSELSQFLEERNVADAGTDPISAREAASLLESHSLFLKAARTLSELNDVGLERWPWWGWGGKDQITQLILGRFQRHSQYTISTRSTPIYLVVGLTDGQRTGEAHLTFWVESDPRKPVHREELLRIADDGALDSSWIRRLDGWQGLSKTQRAATVEGSAETVRWFVARLEELEAAAIRPAAS